MSAARVEAFRLKRPDEIERMRAAGRILGACLAHLAASVRPGITTLDLDREAETFIRDHGCIPGFLGYQGFTNSLCVSINDQVVHGIPGPQVVNEGDLVSLDCGLVLEGWWADSGLSLSCGPAPPEVQRLIEVTREALERGIAAARPGNHIGDIGHAVQTFVESEGYSVVRQYVGHGIGRDMHEPPQVPNYGDRGEGNLLKPGYVLAIEPMVNAGGPEVYTLDDGWTVVTRDGRLSCYFEHTVAITEAGPEVLTLRPTPAAAGSR
ncbi:MAG: type I methionyl aminopeptidase [Candidatus Dormibacteraeota bacterium]|nr:type I methionyl aminopeptidase [Candidatus Dormibacteraeota bacterium]MBV9526292.1 type I methionyl aminopeptidase [Candidatus Dormibacteraeota bacterium]